MFGSSIIAFAPIDVVGSHMAPEAFTGQGGGLNPSVIKKGEKMPRSTVAKSIIAADGSVSAAPGDWQTRTVDASPIPTHPGLTDAPRGAFPGKSEPVRPSAVHGAAPRTNDGPIKAN